MRAAVAAVMMATAGGGAQAAVMTFDEIPYLTDDLVWQEDGITATGTGYEPLVGHTGAPGTYYMANYWAVDTVTFTMEGRFDATSFDLPGKTSYAQSCTEPDGGGDCVPLGFPNLTVRGYRDGALVAQDVFDMFAVGLTYVFGEAFADLDSLVLSVGGSVFSGDPGDGYAWCYNSPCTEISLDNVTLSAVAPVPLPAAGWMLVAALGGLVAMRRK